MGGRGQAHLSLDHGQVKSQKGNGWFLGHCFLNACLVPGIVVSKKDAPGHEARGDDQGREADHR